MEKAQKGDLIRTIKSDSGYFENGEIFEVSGPYYTGVHAKNANHRTLFLGDGEYVIHRKAGEEEVATDAVNPQHYKQGRVEVIDIIEDAVEGADPFEAVCQANVLKYALRYRHKNGVEDLRKSIWYTEKLIAYLDVKSTQD